MIGRTLAHAPPILVGGVNRSGTSLTRQLVGSHPDVAMPPTELGVFDHVLVRQSRKHSHAQLSQIADDLLGRTKVKAWGLDEAAVRERAATANTMRDVFTALLEEYARASGKSRWGEKTTQYEQHLSTLDDWFGQDYVFIHLVRHPVAAFASVRHYGGSHVVDPTRWGWTWRRSAGIALHALWLPQGRSHIVVRYEDLVRDPETQLRGICEKAGFDYDERMLTMSDFEEKETSSFELVGAVYNGAIRVTDTIDRSSRLRDDEIRRLAKVCDATARSLGYDLRNERALAAVSTRRASPVTGVDPGYVAHRARSAVSSLARRGLRRARMHG